MSPDQDPSSKDDKQNAPSLLGRSSDSSTPHAGSLITDERTRLEHFLRGIEHTPFGTVMARHQRAQSLNQPEVRLAVVDVVTKNLSSLLEQLIEMPAEDLIFLRDRCIRIHPATRFLNIQFASPDPNAGRTRIHIWPNGEPKNFSAHNHPWDFTSKVVVGELQTVIYEKAVGSDFFHATPQDKDGYYLATHLGKSSLVPMRNFTTKAGESYSLPHSAIHRAWSDIPTITVMAHGPFKSRFADVFTFEKLPDERPAAGEAGALTLKNLRERLLEAHRLLTKNVK